MRALLMGLLFLCAGLWSLHLSAMEHGCLKSVFEDTDRAELLEYYKEKREEDRAQDSRDTESGENTGADSDAEQTKNKEELKAKIDRKLIRLFNEERRAVFAQHLPEQVICVLRRVQAHHRKLYYDLRELRKKPDTSAQQEELERRLMRIMLFELCTQLGQEGQDLADMSRGQDGWVGCCKFYWTIMGACTLIAVGIACYAPFVPCLPWHG